MNQPGRDKPLSESPGTSGPPPMEKPTFEQKAAVVADLLDRGASSVIVTDSKIEVSRKEYEEAVGAKEPVSQSVEVNVSAQATSSANFTQQIQQLVRQLEQTERDPAKLDAARKQLQAFDEELQRPKPRWSQAKGILKWALGYGEELSMRLAAIWIQQQGLGSG